MTIATDWPSQLAPVQSGDLQDYLQAIASMWDEVEAYQADPENGTNQWQALFDIDLAPLPALIWLAQTVGDRVPVGYNADQARAWIRALPNWNRGTPAAIIASVQRVLTGSKSVLYRWRSRLDLTFDVDSVALMTYVAETPDQQMGLNALRRNVPADIVIDYQCIPGATWGALDAGKTWAQFKAAYGPTWSNVRSQTPSFLPA